MLISVFSAIFYKTKLTIVAIYLLGLWLFNAQLLLLLSKQLSLHFTALGPRESMNGKLAIK
jgi:hypothetical protein